MAANVATDRSGWTSGVPAKTQLPEPPAPLAGYYEDKQDILRDLFGSSAVRVEPGRLTVDGRTYPIVEDVIVLLPPSEYPRGLAERLQADQESRAVFREQIAEDIQYSFGEEWGSYPKILPEHEVEFRQYFDLVDLSSIRHSRICDLGCGIGRWSAMLSPRCREIILVDFSDAIFVARRNLAGCRNALFFLGDLTALPFRDDFADFVICVGVLHHLPRPALEELRSLRRLAPRWLVYLYYAMDNRPFYFRILLSGVTAIRLATSRVRSAWFRRAFTWGAGCVLYLPCLAAGRMLDVVGWGRYMPLHEAYRGKSFERICQDVYDRFFTRMEQRYRRSEILALADAFSRVVVSPCMPYWHFICER